MYVHSCDIANMQWYTLYDGAVWLQIRAGMLSSWKEAELSDAGQLREDNSNVHTSVSSARFLAKGNSFFYLSRCLSCVSPVRAVRGGSAMGNGRDGY